MTTLAFFNNKGGVGKTTLVYHLAHMFTKLGQKVLLVDLDPQTNLTAMCVDEERLEQLWPEDGGQRFSILSALQGVIKGTGDIRGAFVEPVNPRLGLVAGDLGLSRFEGRLSDAWPRAMDQDEQAFRTLSALHRVTLNAAGRFGATLVLIDVGPNLGALNRAALLSADFVVTPLAPDLFSMQGLRNLGPTLQEWRKQWQARLAQNPVASLSLPTGRMQPLGYVLMQAVIRLSHPVKSYERWVRRIPSEYHQHLLQETVSFPDTETDPACLGIMRHYQSLMPLAQDARVPMFELKPADGAIGAHMDAVRRCEADFRDLATTILARVAAALSPPPASPGVSPGA